MAFHHLLISGRGAVVNIDIKLYENEITTENIEYNALDRSFYRTKNDGFLIKILCTNITNK